MSDLIKLLPDHIANQIAAGEVVQRPASVVKELVENAIDAGATKIQLIAKDGGKTLIQVIDNGCGMSDIDARMCFERHATSKIQTADDLFHLQTKGFRGEAMASISAVAHVELKTKLIDKDLGTQISIEGSKIITQEPCSCPSGTSISVKNLFFNIPARRNFLGSNNTEYKHVLNEFLRVALVHHDIAFTFHHNSDLIYNLPQSKLRQRIVHIYGKNYNNRLVPVNEETDIFKITGFVTKPEFARTARDQMFLFVNNRYFKDRYFNHAIQQAFEGMIPSNKYPAYFLYFEVPTESIDVNVHPTKTEIKFENRQEIYSILRSAIKQALGQFNVAPSLDFDQESSFEVPSLKKGQSIRVPEIKINPNFNPFDTLKVTQSSSGFSGGGKSEIKPNHSEWENFYDIAKNEVDTDIKINTNSNQDELIIPSKMDIDEDFSIEKSGKMPYQLHQKYIISPIKTGFIMIDQYRAHSRILFEELLSNWSDDNVKSQQLLFPEEFELSATEMVYLNELLEQLVNIGFDIEIIDQKIAKVTAVPTYIDNQSAKHVIEELINNFKESSQHEDIDFKTICIRTFANSKAIKKGVNLSVEEMENLIDELFACSNPQLSPNGKKIIITYHLEDIIKKFN
jgi:DNA mismatch repair protein MutL